MSVVFGARSVARIATPLLDFIFPPLCVSCGYRLTPLESTICDSCWGKVKRLAPDDTLLAIARKRLCQEGELDGIAACWLFEKEGPLQQLIHKLKYDGMTDVGEMLGRIVAKSLDASFTAHAPTVIIPLPLHRTRKRERGYNQSECIGRGLARERQLPMRPKALERTRFTSTQTHLDHLARVENVRGAFSVSAKEKLSLQGAAVLLVDDVITTGATMGEAARALRDAGVEKVYGCALALADLKAGFDIF
jgi:ComF family protein